MTTQLAYDIGQNYWTSLISSRWSEQVITQHFSVLRSAAWQTKAAKLDIEALAPLLYVREDDGDEHVLVSRHEVVSLVTMAHGQVNIRCAGDAIATVDAEMARWRELLPVAAEKDAISVKFWYLGAQGPRAVPRLVTVPTWEAIAHNYPARVQAALADLMLTFRPSNNGQLVLWNGVPGTGKTYALRALAREWKSWCDIDFITDPDNFFGRHVDYLMNATLGGAREDDEDDEQAGNRWRLLVLEDAGELLMPDAREHVGQGLSRLLNLVDGLLGQGLRLLVLITTNEPVAKMHPAVIRAGRCVSRVEFEGLSREEARAWLTRHHAQDAVMPTGKPTLADLYAAIATRGPIVTHEQPVGFTGA